MANGNIEEQRASTWPKTSLKTHRGTSTDVNDQTFKTNDWSGITLVSSTHRPEGPWFRNSKHLNRGSHLLPNMANDHMEEQCASTWPEMSLRGFAIVTSRRRSRTSPLQSSGPARRQSTLTPTKHSRRTAAAASHWSQARLGWKDIGSGNQGTGLGGPVCTQT
jgi:hypothetical protein